MFFFLLFALSMYLSVSVCLSVRQYVCPCAFLSISDNCTYTCPSVNMALNDFFVSQKAPVGLLINVPSLTNFLLCLNVPYILIWTQSRYSFDLCLVFTILFETVSGDLYRWICVVYTRLCLYTVQTSATHKAFLNCDGTQSENCQSLIM